MHSYISSSNQRYQGCSWFVTWVVGIVLAGGCLFATEFLFRARGHQPSVTDDLSMWAYYRHRVYDKGDKKTVVLLGASRIQLGFSPEAFEEHFPEYRVVQLAVSGSNPFASLRDLANDKRFRGIVIASIDAWKLLRDNRETQQPYVDFYHKTYLSGCYIDDEFNLSATKFFQENLVVNNYELRWDEIIMNLISKRSLPEQNYIVIHSDRSVSADYTKLDIVEHRRKRIKMLRETISGENRLLPAEWLEQAMDVEPFVKAIQKRGGRVVFVRYITTDEHYEFSENIYPKRDYWDLFSKKTNAVTIHFKDVSELSNFNCPDTSHLDFRDVPRFTIALGNELCRLGVIGQ